MRSSDQWVNGVETGDRYNICVISELTFVATDFMNTKYMFIIKWDYVTHLDHVIINNDNVQCVHTYMHVIIINKYSSSLFILNWGDTLGSCNNI